MSSGGLGVDEVGRIARAALGTEAVEVERHPVGYGNVNWLVRESGRIRWVLKVGSPSSAAKWRSTHVAYDLAGQAGLPVPQLVHEASSGEHLVRMFSWIDGRPASTVPPGSSEGDRLLRTLGAAVRTLHQVDRPAFSSRLDGSAPTFASWAGYLEDRLVRIQERSAANGVDPGLVSRASEAALALTDDVDSTAEAVLCHRDLHLDNLIVDETGALAGIIDWDGAEAWDRVGDWFKLEYEVLHAHPDGAEALVGSYLDGEAPPAAWAERRRIVHLVETLNLLANAPTAGWASAYAERATNHLHELLGSPA